MPDCREAELISGMIDGLNRIAARAAPTAQSRTYIVPGHGRLCDREDVVKYRDMAVILRDRIQVLVKKGLALEQVKAAKPTQDYDPLYGASTGLGATDSFDSREDNLREQVVELTKGGVHHAIEAVGIIAAGELALSLLRRGGTATIVGMMPISEKLPMRTLDLLAEKKLQGCLMGSNRFPVDIPRLVDFYLAGRLDLDSVIAERIPLERINDALEKLRTGEAARSVVVFE